MEEEANIFTKHWIQFRFSGIDKHETINALDEPM